MPKPLAAILALYVALALAFNFVTPYRAAGHILWQGSPGVVHKDIGAPDERQHANYVAHIRAGEGFGVFVPGDPDQYENYQFHQAPLYYIIGAAWSLPADPLSQTGGHWLRFLNTLLGLGTLLGIYYGALWGLRRPEVAYACVAFAGLLPSFLALHSAVSNDPLLFFFCTWILALCIRAAVEGYDLRRALEIGALAGLALLTKTSAAAILPVLPIAFWLGSRESRKPWFFSTAGIGAALLIWFPWLARNQTLYGDPLAKKVFEEAFTGNPYAAPIIERIGALNYWIQAVGWWTWRSFLGAFGYIDIYFFESYDPPGLADSDAFYKAMLVVFTIVGLAWLINLRSTYECAQLKNLPNPTPLHLLSAVLLGSALLLFSQFNLTYFQGQARYLFTAIAPIAFGFGLGMVALFRGRPDLAWLGWAIPLLLLDLLAIWLLFVGFAVRLA